MSLFDRCAPLTRLYDTLHAFWEHPATMRKVAAITLGIYLLGLAGIEAKRLGYMPPELAGLVPDSHIGAIHLAFTVILCVEVVGLIFSISASFSRSVGKQLEILALILLRNAFKELGHLSEPVTVAQHWEPVVYIATYALGALFVFIGLRVFMHISPHGHLIPERDLRQRYVVSKKLLALILLVVTVGIGLYDIWAWFLKGEQRNFFVTIYTILIFADITLVLLAQRYMPSFHAVFRNSGFVVGTLLMRLALSATPPLDTAISVFATVYVLLLVWGMNHFEKLSEEGVYDVCACREKRRVLSLERPSRLRGRNGHPRSNLSLEKGPRAGAARTVSGTARSLRK